MFSGSAFESAVAGKDAEFRTAIDKRSDIILQAVHTRPFEAQMQRNLDYMQIQVLVAETFGSPQLATAEIDLRTFHVVQKSEIDAESNAGKHHLGHNTGLEAHGMAYRHQLLLEFQTVHVHTRHRCEPELRGGSNGKYHQKKGKKTDICFFHVHRLRLYI